MLRAFLFDLDGTLLDSEILWVEAVEAWLRDRGHPLTHQEAVDIFYGWCWDKIHDVLTARFPGLGVTLQTMHLAVLPHFTRLREHRDIRIHGSIALFKRLAKDYPVGIVSGSYIADIEHGVAMMGLAPYVSMILGGEDYTPGKPHPAGYIMAAQRLGVAPQECLAFEDSTAGVEAAKGAGMQCVALARKDRPAQDVSKADLVLDDLALFSVEDYLRSRARL